jgi:hypothetical protein
MIQAVVNLRVRGFDAEGGWIPRMVSEFASDLLPIISTPVGTRLIFCPVTRTTWLVYRSDLRCPSCSYWDEVHSIVPSEHASSEPASTDSKQIAN